MSDYLFSWSSHVFGIVRMSNPLHTQSKHTLFWRTLIRREFIIQKSRLGIICKIYPEISFSQFIIGSQCLYVYWSAKWIRKSLGKSCQMGSVRESLQNIWAIILGAESHVSAGKKKENFIEKTESSWVVSRKLVCLNRTESKCSRNKGPCLKSWTPGVEPRW